jgi:predicted nucleic acid-binding protein
MTDAGEPFVVDASITLSWCFEDGTTEQTDGVLGRLEQGRAIAPMVWTLEVANGLRSAERRGRINVGELPSLTNLLLALPIDLDGAVTLEDATGRVLSLAHSFGLSVYDAAYLDLALRRGLELATADTELTRAALEAGVGLVEPMP